MVYIGAAMTAFLREGRIARFYGSFIGQKAYVRGSRRGLLREKKVYRRERLVSLGSGIGKSMKLLKTMYDRVPQHLASLAGSQTLRSASECACATPWLPGNRRAAVVAGGSWI